MVFSIWFRGQRLLSTEDPAIAQRFYDETSADGFSLVITDSLGFIGEYRGAEIQAAFKFHTRPR